MGDSVAAFASPRRSSRLRDSGAGVECSATAILPVLVAVRRRHVLVGRLRNQKKRIISIWDWKALWVTELDAHVQGALHSEPIRLLCVSEYPCVARLFEGRNSGCRSAEQSAAQKDALPLRNPLACARGPSSAVTHGARKPVRTITRRDLRTRVRRLECIGGCVGLSVSAGARECAETPARLRAHTARVQAPLGCFDAAQVVQSVEVAYCPVELVHDRPGEMVEH
ncbi:hypothetical protein GGX14DRAFT_393978 [Mycena pura]|uniref:Uncharacterized protein n=1 Tax=Mycena pura TaxID=153505 RepID=A0AAD6YG52_9AGAR|nr:hypothetical protein GGX14DRAFT_393978 [Mycena pura]